MIPRTHIAPNGPEFSRLVYGTWRFLDDEATSNSADLLKRLHACLDLGITTLDDGRHMDGIVDDGFRCVIVFPKVEDSSPCLTDHDFARTGLMRRPMEGQTISTRSPAFSGPTPDGVPVEITSPGSNVITWLMNDTSVGISKINFDVEDDCRRWPFT